MTVAIRFAVSIFIVTVALALPAFAADSHGAGGHEPTSLWDLPKRWDLSIYTMIVFLLLLAILSKFAWPAITEGLKAREDLIAQAKEEAIKAKADAQAMQTKLTAEFASASDKIRAMMDEARRDADALRVKERDTGAKEAAAERERAKREIETAKDQALQEIYQKSVDVAALMSSKAIKRTMTAADHARLLDESLADLKNSVSRN
jgi:F-type H+-transporting ATPase subunit b